MMRRFVLYRWAPAVFATAALAGCGGVIPGSDSASPAASSSASSSEARSWMLPEAKSENLLYVASADNHVYVFTYPKAKLVGRLSVSLPRGECVDAKNDVWITSEEQVVEYAHGGRKPIAQLSDPFGLAEACAIDATTGDLAVTNEYKDFVVLYKAAQGRPATYRDRTIRDMYYCGYDDRGNLFVDGVVSQSKPFALSELAKGAHRLRQISVNQVIYAPGGVQWDGKYLAVGDRDAGGESTSAIYQFTVSGGVATEIGSTPLDGSARINQFWIQGPRVVGPDDSTGDSGNVGYWRYPAGGPAIKTFGSGLAPVGSAVSLR